jgi:hypothetical protein
MFLVRTLYSRRQCLIPSISDHIGEGLAFKLVQSSRVARLDMLVVVGDRALVVHS